MPVSGNDLRALTGTTKTDAELALFLTEGQFVVDNLLAGKSVDPAVLNFIALYCAGHFYVLSVEGGGITYAKVGMSEERYKSFGYETYGFMTTRFGQMACAYDTSGTLVSLSKKDKVEFAIESYTNRKAPPSPPKTL
jgi:hypothetical protein